MPVIFRLSKTREIYIYIEREDLFLSSLIHSRSGSHLKMILRKLILFLKYLGRSDYELTA